MKTIIELDRQEEIDALYGEGFTLHFGSESVVVKVLQPQALDTRSLLEKMTGVPMAKRKPKAPDKEFKCDIAGCDYQANKAGWLRNHKARDHKTGAL